MKNHHIVFFFSIFLVMSFQGFVSCTEETKVYVVLYLDEHSGDMTLKEIEDHHCSFLRSVKSSTASKEDVRASLVHSYKNVINGFSAWLTPQEADMISGMEGVISVFHSDPHAIKPHTTRSWDFVSLLEGTSLVNSGDEMLQNASYGKDIIVGVIDSGVWPESSSFNDEGMEPVPKSWKGICQEGVAFNASHCNRKLIGARYYLENYEAHFGPLNETRDFRSPRDVGDVQLTGTTASNTTGSCLPGSLSRNLVIGKVVLCRNRGLQASMEVKRAGGVAAILGNPFNEIQVTPFLDPKTVVFSYSLDTIQKYIQTEKNPMATLLPGNTLIGTKPAPAMASFSSKGPNIVDLNILKPDITAPGFSILAAWSESSSPLKLPEDRRVVKYNMQSGTSMCCPHVSAAIALIKSIHPDWSSAAIRSALMTTATTNNVVGRPITNATGDNANPFEYGVGHFRPSRAVDPGLIYDATYTDYLLYLCSQNISLGSLFSCPEKVSEVSNLNYPSLAIANTRGSSRTVTRVVTNVGKDSSTYVSAVRSPPGYVVDIVPKTLHFSKLGEKCSFSITVKAQNVEWRNKFSFGWYTWSDGVHVVRSPIAVSLA